MDCNWNEYFVKSGIKEEFAERYAKTFQENRIQECHIPHLNKQWLNELGVEALGDVICILGHSKPIKSQENDSNNKGRESSSSIQVVKQKVVKSGSGQLTLNNNLSTLGPELQVTDKESELLKVEMDREKIQEESRIYGKSGKEEGLTKYQKSINDAAFSLCLENGNLINNKGTLLELARKKVDNEGYIYAKKRSRSKSFGSGQQELLDDKAWGYDCLRYAKLPSGVVPH